MIKLVNRRTLTILTRIVLGVTGVALVFAAEVADNASGLRLWSTVFNFIPVLALYLAPVALVTWFAGRWAGILLCACLTIAGPVAYRFVVQPLEPFPISPLNVVASLILFLVFTHLVATIRTQLVEQKTLARTDFLTKTHNSRSFREYADVELERASRYGGILTVAYIDLDDFKLVNDRYGHAVGDLVLHTVAAAIDENIRKLDVLARLGGDEFVLLMPQTDARQAKVILHRLRTALLKVMHDSNWPVTVSIGAVTFVTLPASTAQMLEVADAAMYVAKKAGKNQIRHEVMGARGKVAPGKA